MKAPSVSLDGCRVVAVQGLEEGDLVAATIPPGCTTYHLTCRADAATWITVRSVSGQNEDGVVVVTGSFQDGMPFVQRLDRDGLVIAREPNGGVS